MCIWWDHKFLDSLCFSFSPVGKFRQLSSPTINCRDVVPSHTPIVVNLHLWDSLEHTIHIYTGDQCCGDPTIGVLTCPWVVLLSLGSAEARQAFQGGVWLHSHQAVHGIYKRWEVASLFEEFLQIILLLFFSSFLEDLCWIYIGIGGFFSIQKKTCREYCQSPSSRGPGWEGPPSIPNIM